MEENVFYREVNMVEALLGNFIFSTASTRDTQIDLNLIIKALPVRVDKNNYYRVEMFNFASVQASITAFSNTAQDELFKHYDDRNKARLRKLRTKASVTEDLTEELKVLAQNVISILLKINATGKKNGVVQIERNEKLAEKTQGRIQEEKTFLTTEDVKRKVRDGIQDYFKNLKDKEDDYEKSL